MKQQAVRWSWVVEGEVNYWEKQGILSYIFQRAGLGTGLRSLDQELKIRVVTGNGSPREWRKRGAYRRPGDRDCKEFSISFHFFLSFLLFLLYSSLPVVARIRERAVDKIFQRFPSSGYWNSSEDQSSSGSLKRKDRTYTMIGSGLCFTIVLQIMKYWIIKMLSINEWL